MSAAFDAASDSRKAPQPNATLARDARHGPSSLPIPPHQPVAAQFETPLLQPCVPAVARPDRSGFVQQAMLFFLPSQPSEFFSQRVIGRQECLFAVQDRRVVAGEIVPAIEFPRPQVQLHAPQQRRVRIGFEIRVGQVRHLAGNPVQFVDRGLSPICASYEANRGLTPYVTFHSPRYVRAHPS